MIRRGKAAKPTEFDKLVKLQEVENQIVIDYEVYAQRPNDADLLIPAIEMHVTKLGRVPRLLAADVGFYSSKNEIAARARGVKRVCIPNRSTKSADRRREQKKRWFRSGQRWRTGRRLTILTPCTEILTDRSGKPQTPRAAIRARPKKSSHCAGGGLVSQ